MTEATFDRLREALAGRCDAFVRNLFLSEARVLET